jgi:adenylate cyclase
VVEKKDNIKQSEVPSTEEIQAALEHILGSQEFQRSKRLRNLLEYLFTETLNGSGDRIKAVSIAIDLYGRDETFDSQNDTIVRVEAGRLRRLLNEYYHNGGQKDLVVITIPKGTYRPIFALSHQQNPIVSMSTARNQSPETASSIDRRILYVTAAVAVATLVMVIWSAQRNSDIPSTSELDRNAAVSIESGPFIMILPIQSLEEDSVSQRMSVGLTEALITNLAKLTGLSVMAHASVLGAYNEPVLDDRKDQLELGISHILRGTLELDSTNAWINVQLTDASSGKVQWAERWSHSLENLANFQEDLALKVANELSVKIDPEERRRLTFGHTSNHEALVYYRQALVMMSPPNEITRVLTTRNLFQRVKELDPSFAGGYAGESFSHSITVLFLKTDDPEAELSVALELSQRAIDLDPEFGMGFATLSFAQLFSGDIGPALQNAKRAVEIQPGDAFTQFILGMNMIIAGRPEDSFSALNAAIRLDPIEPRTPYRNVLAIGYYAAGQYEKAIELLNVNLKRGGPRGPHMDVFSAAANAQVGNSEDAKVLLEQFTELYPKFPVKGWLSHWLASSKQLDSTIELLHQHGLPRQPSILDSTVSSNFQ